MNVYIIETNDLVAGKALIAANDHKEAGRIFNDHFSYIVENPLKELKCTIYPSDTLQTSVITPQLLLDCIY